MQEFKVDSPETDSMSIGELFKESKPLRPGDLVEGVVVSCGPEGVWVGIGSKFEGVIPQTEMQTAIDDGKQLKEGDRVQVYVLRAGSEKQQPVLSLDRAVRFEGWRNLEKLQAQGAALKAKVAGFNKGGLIVNYEGIQGFVPSSQLDGYQRGAPGGENALDLKVGKELTLTVMEVDRQRNRLILSERAAMTKVRYQQREELLSRLVEGTICQGKVKAIHDFGVFVDMGGADGLVPASELSWERGKAACDIVHLGEEVSVLVMRIDGETKKIALSLRQARPHPWETIGSKYQPGQVVEGTVTKIVAFGAFVSLDSGIEGLVHISEMANRHVNHPGEVVKKGDAVKLKVLSVDPEARRIRLSLRQAETDFGNIFESGMGGPQVLKLKQEESDVT